MRDRIHNIILEATESRDAENRKLVRSIINKIRKNINSIDWKLCGKDWGLRLSPSANVKPSDRIFLYGIEFQLSDIFPSVPVRIAFVHRYRGLYGGGYDAQNNTIFISCFDEIPHSVGFMDIERYKMPKSVDGWEYSVTTYKRFLELRFKNIEETLFHELIHCLDHTKRNVPMGSSTGRRGMKSDEYYISPEEFNAYYQEFVNYIKNKKKYYGMSFPRFLTALKQDGVFGFEFLEAIFRTPEYKRKIEKRLYNWYVENIATQKKDKA